MKVSVAGHDLSIDTDYIAASSDSVRNQIHEYLSGERESFTLSIQFPDGFLGRVMREMDEIPYGETRTYGEIADQLGTAAVAVGQACSRNPVPVIVPCHRVVAADGIGGYAYPISVKNRLINLEASD